ncbi:MAG: IclR family transcriptional regulator [Gammaproteobacteria bacterium]|nr:IclR family transcriptional regulator [Gammaproteobacteria bacterium]
MKVDNKQKYSVPALDKAFEIFEYLAANPSPKTQSEIALGVKRNANQIYRILVNLEQSGFLLREPSSGRYHLSLRLYNLSRSISPIDQVRQCAMPLMDDLAAKTGLSCHLSMLHQSQSMVIVHANTQSSVSLNIAEGALFPILSSNSGKLLLANSNDEVQKLLLERTESYLHYSEAEKQALEKELIQVQQQGYIKAPSMATLGVYNFTTLIGKPFGKVIASLTLSSLNNRLEGLIASDEIERLTLETAQQITEQLSL